MKGEIMKINNNIHWRLVDENGEIASRHGDIRIPETAKITITRNCGECDWKGMTPGHKHFCNNPRSFANRPYITNRNNPERNRDVNPETMPVWCPL
jgi:hypothetical protein